MFSPWSIRKRIRWEYLNDPKKWTYSCWLFPLQALVLLSFKKKKNDKIKLYSSFWGEDLLDSLSLVVFRWTICAMDFVEPKLWALVYLLSSSLHHIFFYRVKKGSGLLSHFFFFSSLSQLPVITTGKTCKQRVFIVKLYMGRAAYCGPAAGEDTPCQ